MTARTATATLPRPRVGRGLESLSWLAVAAGLALLLARLWLTGPWATTGLIITFAALAAVSLAAPAAFGLGATVAGTLQRGATIPAPVPQNATRPAPLPAWVVLSSGVGAVAVAAAASGLPGPAAPIAGGVRALAIVVVGAIAEEAFFRRLLYGRLLRWGAPVAVLGSALLFGALHVPLHGVAALPVDLGAGLFLSWQRWASGSWASPAATHALANIVAVLR